MRTYKRPERIFLFVILGIAGLFIFSAIVMALWNAILPDLVNVGRLNIWQAMGLLALSKILFSGFGRGGHRGRWRDRMDEKHWAKMSPEEKEKFKNEWRSRCRWPESTPAPPQQTPGDTQNA